MDVRNIRSPEQFRIISEFVDFKDKVVADFGYGYGDIMRMVADAGARRCVGFDKDTICATNDDERLLFVNKDIEEIEVSDGSRVITVSGVTKEQFEKIVEARKKQETGKYSPLPSITVNQSYDVTDIYVQYDIGICFSVLPYLKKPASFLYKMKKLCELCLIECQYDGDGPGFSFIKSDATMAAYLYGVGFREIVPIGKTYVEGRNKYRTIWMCS